jgi:hypothetical protein
MKYEDIRNDIRTGDIVFVYSPTSFTFPKSFLYWLIKLVTGLPIHHCVVAQWMSTDSGTHRLMAVEACPQGKRIIPLSFYQDRKLQVFRLPANVNVEALEEYLMARVAKESYSYCEFFGVGLRELLGIKLDNFKGKICSEICVDAWVAAGQPLLESRISPAELWRTLTAMDYDSDLQSDAGATDDNA